MGNIMEEKEEEESGICRRGRVYQVVRRYICYLLAGWVALCSIVGCHVPEPCTHPSKNLDKRKFIKTKLLMPPLGRGTGSRRAREVQGLIAWTCQYVAGRFRC